jgi:hypothetical protein
MSRPDNHFKSIICKSLYLFDFITNDLLSDGFLDLVAFLHNRDTILQEEKQSNEKTIRNFK